MSINSKRISIQLLIFKQKQIIAQKNAITRNNYNYYAIQYLHFVRLETEIEHLVITNSSKINE